MSSDSFVMWFFFAVAVFAIVLFFIYAIWWLETNTTIFPQKAHALNMVCSMRQGSLVGYNVYMNVKINGHPIKMLLDTGCDISVISGNSVSALGLNNLPSSGSVPMTSMSGQTQNEQAVNIQMCIENARCFNTSVLLNPQQLSGIHGGADNMLSLHDLYQGFRLTFTPLR